MLVSKLRRKFPQTNVKNVKWQRTIDKIFKSILIKNIFQV